MYFELIWGGKFRAGPVEEKGHYGFFHTESPAPFNKFFFSIFSFLFYSLFISFSSKNITFFKLRLLFVIKPLLNYKNFAIANKISNISNFIQSHLHPLIKKHFQLFFNFILYLFLLMAKILLFSI